MEERRIGPGQIKPDRMRIEHDNSGELVGLAAIRFFETLDGAEEACTGALGLRVDRAFDRPFHVVRGNGPAIVELCLRMELERVLSTIRRDLIALGKLRNEVRRAGL